jgi:putative addiction module CopG family antidote
MNIKLPRELERYVRNKVASGRYASVNDVIAEAVRSDRDAEAELLRELDKGIADIRAGRVFDWDVKQVQAEFLRSLKKKKAV